MLPRSEVSLEVCNGALACFTSSEQWRLLSELFSGVGSSSELTCLEKLRQLLAAAAQLRQLRKLLKGKGQSDGNEPPGASCTTALRLMTSLVACNIHPPTDPSRR